jgi:uncharacterized protein (TIGR03437 family)
MFLGALASHMRRELMPFFAPRPQAAVCRIGKEPSLSQLQRSMPRYILAAIALLAAGAVQAQPNIVVDQTAITFTAPVNGSVQTASRTVTSSGAALNLNVLPSTASGIPWLGATLNPATTPSTLTVTANPQIVSLGSHEGVVILSSNQGSPLVQIRVTLNVTASTTNLVNPASLSFNFTSGSTAPQTANLNVTGSGSGQAFTISNDQAANPWITIFPTQGVTPMSVSVLANPSGRADGTYTANLTLSFTALGTTATIPVTMQIAATPSLVVPKDPLRFNYQVGGSAPATQRTIVNVTSSGAPVPFTAAAATQTGLNWLLVTPAGGATPSPVTIEVNATNLPAGTYTGTVTIAPFGSTGGGQDIPVTLTVSTLPLLSFTRADGQPTAALTFTHQFGGTPPDPQTLASVSTGTALTYVVTPVYTKGSNWLQVNPAQNTTPAGFTVTAVPDGLTPDTYTANLLVVSSGAGNPQQNIPVTLVVSNDPQLTLSLNRMTFVYETGRTLPGPLTATVAGTTAPLSFTAAAVTNSGGNWLSVTPASGNTPTDLRVEVVPAVLATLAPGSYTGSVVLTSPNAANSGLRLDVTLWVANGPLITVNRQALQFTAQSGSTPNPEQLAVTSTSTQFPISVTTSITNPPGSQWMIASPLSPSTPTTVTVFANPSGLAPGTYRGFVIISAEGIPNTDTRIPVTLTVSGGTLNTSPASLSFTQPSGGAAPAKQTINITSTGSVLNWTATAIAHIGGNWLTISPGSGTTPGTLDITVDGRQLPAGTYTGDVTVVSPGAIGSPRRVPVTLTVTTPVTVAANPATLTFSAQQGGAAPATQTVAISSTPAGQAFTAAAATDRGGNWLSVTPTSGTTPGNLTVSVNPQGLAAGSYTGSVTVTVPGAGNSPLAVRVTFTVAALPTPLIATVKNSASFLGGAISPGEIVVLEGTNLGPATGVSATVTNNMLPTAVSDVSVSFDGIPAPLLYVSATQINAIVPYHVAGRVSTRIQVTYRSVSSATLEQFVADTAPGLYTLNASGSGPGAIRNQDLQVNTANNPAAKGSIVVIYATGEGQTFPAGVNGRITNDTFENLRRPLAVVTVTIGGQPADVIYAGAAPGFPAGALQINARISENAASGQVPVVVTIGSANSQPGVTVSVR